MDLFFLWLCKVGSSLCKAVMIFLWLFLFNCVTAEIKLCWLWHLQPCWKLLFLADLLILWSCFDDVCHPDSSLSNLQVFSGFLSGLLFECFTFCSKDFPNLFLFWNRSRKKFRFRCSKVNKNGDGGSARDNSLYTHFVSLLCFPGMQYFWCF